MRNERLRALLDEAGWRPETFARRICAHARRQGLPVTVHEKTPYSWIRDGRCPRDPVPQIAGDVLAERLGRAVGPSDLGWHTGAGALVRADDGLAGLWLATGVILGLREVSSDVQRRGFLALTSSALTAAALQAIVAEPDRLAATLDGGRRLNASTVADFEHLAELRRRMDDELGGGALHEALSSDLRLVTQVVSTTSYPEPLGRRLYTVAAELARLAGWCCHDTGNEGAAQRYWMVALRAAHEAQDPPLKAHVLTFMGIQAMEVSSPHEAVTLLASGKRAGGDAIGATQRAVLGGIAAGAHARAGDPYATATQVDQLFTYLDRSEPVGDPPWLYWCTRAELTGDAGSAYLHLGQPATALPHLEAATDLLDAPFARDRADRMVGLATARLRTGDAEDALATAHEATDLAARLDSGKVRDLLGGFCREANHTLHNRAAAELTEHARTALHA